MFNGHRYQVFNTSMKWSEAKKACELTGGHLVTITSQQEQNFLINLVRGEAKNTYWIGLYKSGSSRKWVTGEAVSYTNIEYENGDQYFYGMYSKSDSYLNASWNAGQWYDHEDRIYNDYWDYTKTGYICEWDKTSIKNAAVTLEKSSYEYTGKEIKPSVTVTMYGYTLKKGTDYTVSYKNNISLGTATITVTGIGNFTDSVKKTFKIGYSIGKAAITLKKSTYIYNGFQRKPKVTVKLNVNNKKKTLVKNKDYTVAYQDNIKPGFATVMITGKGNYTGTVIKQFVIKPRVPASVSVKSKKSGQITVSWKTRAEAEYYEVRYSTSSKFNNASTVTVKSNTLTFEEAKNLFGKNNKGTVITGLQSRKKYYIQVRSYANGQYSNWSGRKSVKTKK